MPHLPLMLSRLWWSDVESFSRELRSATDERLAEMHRWAKEREQESDRPGRGETRRLEACSGRCVRPPRSG